VASIFVLRLFNDGVESVLMQASVLFFVIARSRSHSGQHIRHQWLMDVIACLLYSMAVSVKMNALLYAPAVLVLLWEAHGFLQTLIYLVGVCGSWQLVIGWRFLRQHPWSYLRKAFEFGRVFDQRWSVNFACLPEHVFVHPCWAALLLTLHVLALALFGVRAGVPLWLRCRPSENAESRVNAFRTALLLWSSNLIGMAFARSLHYQFLEWVWWSSPFLALADWMMAVELFRPRVDLMAIGWRLVPVLLIELVFNQYPPKCWASVVLHIAHACLLVRVWATVARWRRRDEQTLQRRPVCVQPRPGMDDERQSMYVPERAAAERRQRLGVAATK
jgi:alpha-1,3-mannosyltransferase